MPYSPVHRPWTPEDEQVLIDTYSTLTARLQADKLGRPREDVVAKRARMVKKGQLSIYERAYHPVWSPEQDDWLRDNYHKYTMKTLSRRLGRTECAIWLRKRRLNIRRTDGFYTCRALAEIFRCDPKRIASLYEQGYLTGKRAPYLQGQNRPWVFNEGDVEAFIRTYPWLTQPDKMQEHYFRSMVRDEWARDPWYSCKDAAEIVGIGDDALQKRLRSGEVPAFQRSPGKAWSRWWIRRTALLTHFKRHDTRDRRSAAMKHHQTEGRLRKGLPIKVATVWAIACQECAERYTVETPYRGNSKDALQLAAQQHQCPNQQEVAA